MPTGASLATTTTPPAEDHPLREKAWITSAVAAFPADHGITVGSEACRRQKASNIIPGLGPG